MPVYYVAVVDADVDAVDAAAAAAAAVPALSDPPSPSPAPSPSPRAFLVHRIENALCLGLEDNWSQLRLASLLAAKTFLPPRTVGGGQRRLLAAVAVPPELG